MQYTLTPHRLKLPFAGSTWWQLALFAAVCLAIWYKVDTLNEDFLAWLRDWLPGLSDKHYILLTGMLLLMPVNWGLEAYKWQLLARFVVPLSYWQAYMGVLSGLSMGFISPPAIGDYLGRVWQLPGKGRYPLLGAVLINRACQLLITLSMGVWAIAAFAERQNQPQRLSTYLLMIVCVTAGLILLLFWKRKSLQGLAQIKGWSRVAAIMRVTAAYPPRLLVQILLLSWLRYLTFSSQFLLAMWLCEVELPILTLGAGIAWVFLIKSIIPGFHALQALGIRELSAILFFESLTSPVSSVIWAGLLLWGINILVPATGGVWTLLRAKL